MERPLRFGIFMAPFHPAGQNPTLALERDLETLSRPLSDGPGPNGNDAMPRRQSGAGAGSRKGDR